MSLARTERALVGALTVSQMLAMPFGKDVQDFPVTHYVESAAAAGRRQMEARAVAASSAATPAPLTPAATCVL